MKIKLDATACSLIYFTAKSLYMFGVSPHPSSGVLKTVTATSDTGHNIGTATSLQRGWVFGFVPWVTIFETCVGHNGIEKVSVRKSRFSPVKFHSIFPPYLFIFRPG
jgi:hypothetical protein